MKIIKSKIMLLLVFYFTAYADSSVYAQGEWLDIRYHIASEKIKKDSKKMISTIKVTNSTYIITDNWIRVFVYFSVKNTQKYPVEFGWKNKYLVDENGAAFYPSKGIASKKLQPYEESTKCYAEYLLPKKVNIKKLSWGLYATITNKFRYKIIIHPKKER